jgi:hypothetical protein
LLDRCEYGGADFERMDRRELEIDDFGGRRWFVEVQPGIVGVRMAVPATLPSRSIVVFFDVVDREIARREPPNVESGGCNQLRVTVGVQDAAKELGFVRIRIERGLGDE